MATGDTVSALRRFELDGVHDTGRASPHSHCSDDCVSVSLPAPSDYTSITAVNVTFAPEQTEQLVLLITIPDSTVEGRETLSAVLSDASEGVTIRQETANITIKEDTCKLYFSPLYIVGQRVV